MIQINVRVKNYLKEFLTSLYSSDIIPASRNNIVGLYLINLLEKSPCIPEKQKIKNNLLDITNQLQSILTDEKLIAKRNALQKRLTSIEYYETSENRTELTIDLIRDESYNPEHRNYLSYNNKVLFESMIGELFNELFLHYIKDRQRLAKTMNVKIQIKDSILQFCNDYNIGFNDTNYETLKKKYYRWEKQQLELTIKKHSQIVPIKSRAFTSKIFSNSLLNKNMQIQL